MNGWLSVTLVVILFLTSSCDQNVVYEKNYTLENLTWTLEDRKEFNFEISDTNQLYNLYLNLRNSKSYRYSNLYIFLKTKYPSGKLTKDTLQFYLADPTGRWLGKSAGDLVSHQIMFSRKMRFPEAGAYSIQLEQGMRDSSLGDISDVGLRVEKFKQ